MLVAGRESDAIAGPLGTFWVPASPPETRRICEGLSRLLWDGEYEHAEMPREGIRSILDIGAGWGAFAVWAKARFGDDIKIDCYEPHALGSAYVAANAPFATGHRVAVTVKPSARLHIGEDWGASTTHFREEGEAVPVLHPRELPPCDLLKIDAEGIEPETLAAYPHLRDVCAVTYEWHCQAHRAECQRICAAAGLRCVTDHIGPWGEGTGTAIWISSARS